MMIKKEQYENRVIVFIDILGFREHINQTVQDSAYFIKMRNILNYIYKLKKENEEGILAQKEIGREITIFSDSIVISYPAELLGSVFYLLIDVVHIQLEMLAEGVLLRGGLTVGKLCHNDNIVYGPAMVESYELESKVAVYPRVIVSEKVLHTAIQYSLNPPEIEIEYVQNLLNKDFDEQYYIDFMSQWQEVDEEEAYFNALYTIKEVIEKAIQVNLSKPSIQVKYQWLKRYFNSVLDKFKPEYAMDLFIH